MPDQPFARIGIIGVGLMGGSLGAALRSQVDPPRVTGFSDDSDELVHALERGLIDAAAPTLDAALRGQDLIVLATPLEPAMRILTELSEAHDGATITDVVSLKAPMARAARAGGVEADYVGGHPLCGAEVRGPAAARAELYREQKVFLVRGDARDETAASVERLWRSVGGEPVWVDAEEHDRRMVWVSHLPQIVSNALAAAIGDAGHPASALGPGGRDMTRLAGSSAEVWRDLFAEAGPELAAAMRRVASELTELAGGIDAGDVEAVDALMRATAAWKESR